jgi:hypothetical protein
MRFNQKCPEPHPRPRRGLVNVAPVRRGAAFVRGLGAERRFAGGRKPWDGRLPLKSRRAAATPWPIPVAWQECAWRPLVRVLPCPGAAARKHRNIRGVGEVLPPTPSLCLRERAGVRGNRGQVGNKLANTANGGNRANGCGASAAKPGTNRGGQCKETFLAVY